MKSPLPSRSAPERAGQTGLADPAPVVGAPTPITRARRRCEARWSDAGRLVLSPLPPLTNRICRRGWKWLRGGAQVPVTYKSAEARAWQSAMVWQLRSVLPRWSEAERGSDWAVLLWLYFPDARRRDPDGPIKLLLDTLAIATRSDDRRFLPRVMARVIDRAAPRVEFVLEPLLGEPNDAPDCRADARERP